MTILTLAAKDLRLLLRDRRALIILVAMPFIFILVLGLSLGESFGRKPDDRLRVSLVNRDQGDRLAKLREATSVAAVAGSPLGGLALATFHQIQRPPAEPWAKVVQRDLEDTADIRVELIENDETAQRLIQDRQRAAVLVFGPEFSDRVTQCSFLADGNNPFFRDGVNLTSIDAHLLRDPTQEAAASIIEQVAQVTMLRVILPWMIGRAFEKLGEPSFLDLLGERVHVEVPVLGRVKLKTLLTNPQYKKEVGEGIQRSLQELFPKYNLTGKTWASLTRSDPRAGSGAGSTLYEEEGAGILKRGAFRYQILVPSYTVMFAFFLVLTVGWLFVGERRQGTLRRLQAAPVTRSEILAGKLLPCYLLSLGQGLFLLGAGKLVFGMSWGPDPIWLVPVVLCTSLAAMGMALLIASVARTETQVAIYGSLLVLVLAAVSGCLMPRELMPEEMKTASRLTPHAWALDAYKELLLTTAPNYTIVATSCGVLAAFGLVFIALAWWSLRLD
jgi:ABC-2 type transport system permease protein